jgi:hypothetical protein
MHVIEVRNVNEAYGKLYWMLRNGPMWREITPRGDRTLEWLGPVATTYARPAERVLFDDARDANPFFHLFEALWIASGRRDTGFIKEFLPAMMDYSDNKLVFNAAYGHRLRVHFGVDQLVKVAELLEADPDSRRAFMVIGDPEDLTRATRDVACNVAVFFKIRDGQLNMLVSNRSNDAIWGAYGANAVQFSFLQELIAAHCKVEMGTYTQLSDSFHIYPDSEKGAELLERSMGPNADPYQQGLVKPYPIMAPGHTIKTWLLDCEAWVDLAASGGVSYSADPFFKNVAAPMLRAFRLHRRERKTKQAIEMLSNEHDPAIDWLQAGIEWLTRRLT